jgi:hypothetical protein
LRVEVGSLIQQQDKANPVYRAEDAFKRRNARNPMVALLRSKLDPQFLLSVKVASEKLLVCT